MKTNERTAAATNTAVGLLGRKRGRGIGQTELRVIASF